MLCQATLCHGRQRRWGAPHIKLTCCTAISTVGSTATNQNCWAASTARGAQQVLLTHVHSKAASRAARGHAKRAAWLLVSSTVLCSGCAYASTPQPMPSSQLHAQVPQPSSQCPQNHALLNNALKKQLTAEAVALGALPPHPCRQQQRLERRNERLQPVVAGLYPPSQLRQLQR